MSPGDFFFNESLEVKRFCILLETSIPKPVLYSQRNKYWFLYFISYTKDSDCFHCSEYFTVLHLTYSVSIEFLLIHLFFLLKKAFILFFCDRQDRKMGLKLMSHSLYHSFLVMYDLSNFDLTIIEFASIYWKLSCFLITFSLANQPSKIMHIIWNN